MILLCIRSLFRIITISHNLLAVIDDAASVQGLSQETQDKHADIRARLRKTKLFGLAFLPIIPFLVSVVVFGWFGGLERKMIMSDASIMATVLTSWQRVVYDVANCLSILVAIYLLWIPAGVRNQVIVTQGSPSSHVGDILPEPSAPMVQDTHGEESSGPLRAPLEITMLHFNGTPIRSTSVMMPMRSSDEKSGTPTLTSNTPPRGTEMRLLRAPAELGGPTPLRIVTGPPTTEEMQ
jgi:hypothetical protein